MALQGSDYFIIERGSTVYNVLGSDILAYVQANIGSTEYDVADIAARNALTGLTTGDRVFVVDASADATVTSGWAIYVWRGSGFTKVAEEEGLDVSVGGADLSYTASATQGVVASSTGTDATIPAANGTNAGLMVPAQVIKVGHLMVTAATDLDAMRTASHAAVTLVGTTNTNPLTLTGQALGFSISQLTAAP
jgi:hypothetical protein